MKPTQEPSTRSPAPIESAAQLLFWNDATVGRSTQSDDLKVVVYHTLDLLEAVYVSIFSCKEYDAELAEQITKEWFGAKECKTHFLERI